jgi:hypothetical protein
VLATVGELGIDLSIHKRFEALSYHSGDGREAKRDTWGLNEDPNSPQYNQWSQENLYYLRSSVMGNEVVSEVEATGRKQKTFVLAAGATVATQVQSVSGGTTYQDVYFDNWDASGATYRTMDKTGVADYGENTERSPGELDPMGGNMGLSTPYVQLNDTPPPPDPVSPTYFQTETDSPMYVNGQKVTFYLDGIEVSYSMAMSAVEDGSAVQCPNNDCSPRQVVYQGQKVWASFQAYADGYSGFVPHNATYIGNGAISPIDRIQPFLLGKGQSQFPNDTNFVALNGASGKLIGEGIAVLNNIGVDAFWNMNLKFSGSWGSRWINNAERERISEKDLTFYRELVDRTLAMDRCSKFLQKIGINPEDILKAFDLTRIQGGFHGAQMDMAA